MFYQLLVHYTFHSPDIYSPEMELDKTLVLSSPAYAANADLIDEWLSLEKTIGEDIIDVVAKVTDFVSPDSTEQIIQIECTKEEADMFLEHALLPRFLELRMSVGYAILDCEYEELTTLSATPTSTYTSYAEARANFTS